MTKAKEIRRPTAAQERQWDAENIVRRNLTRGAVFDAEVRRVAKELARIEKESPKPKKVK